MRNLRLKTPACPMQNFTDDVRPSTSGSLYHLKEADFIRRTKSIMQTSVALGDGETSNNKTFFRLIKQPNGAFYINFSLPPPLSSLKIPIICIYAKRARVEKNARKNCLISRQLRGDDADFVNNSLAFGAVYGMYEVFNYAYLGFGKFVNHWRVGSICI